MHFINSPNPSKDDRRSLFLVRWPCLRDSRLLKMLSKRVLNYVLTLIKILNMRLKISINTTVGFRFYSQCNIIPSMNLTAEASSEKGAERFFSKNCGVPDSHTDFMCEKHSKDFSPW